MRVWVPGGPGRSMADAMPYRGPDDSGVWVSPDGKCALAHRRLSIIDTTSGGHQPFVLGAGRHALSFNGEIYNYLDLKRELEANGHAFQTKSDTEVLLHLLAEHGEQAIERLDGQFAFGTGRPPTGSCCSAAIRSARSRSTGVRATAGSRSPANCTR